MILYLSKVLTNSSWNLTFKLTLVFSIGQFVSSLKEKAHKAMEALWKYRSHHSDLVGTTINIHSGDWTRRGSFVSPIIRGTRFDKK